MIIEKSNGKKYTKIKSFGNRFLKICVVSLGALLVFIGVHIWNVSRNGMLSLQCAIARRDMWEIEYGVNGFYKVYKRYPCEKNFGTDETDYFCGEAKNQGALISILRGEDNPMALKFNQQRIAFINVPTVRDLMHPKEGIGKDGAWYDPWGRPYLIRIDSNYNGLINNPYAKNAGSIQIKREVIIWSLGADGKGAISLSGKLDKNADGCQDDVISWGDDWYVWHLKGGI